MDSVKTGSIIKEIPLAAITTGLFSGVNKAPSPQISGLRWALTDGRRKKRLSGEVHDLKKGKKAL
jgi:hypothetical protein